MSRERAGGIVGAAGRPLTFATFSFEDGGLDHATGDDSQWQATITALQAAAPGVVLLQEMDDRGDPYWLRRTAALGMEPVRGPSAAIRSRTVNHTAILVAERARTRLRPVPGMSRRGAGRPAHWHAEAAWPGDRQVPLREVR